MYREFEGKTEEEAIEKAVSDLNINDEQVDFEIVESVKKGIFRKGNVKIRVFVEEDNDTDIQEESVAIDSDIIDKVREFVSELLNKMGFPGEIYVKQVNNHKLLVDINSEHSNIIIGKKGKNLDAIQLITNVYTGKIDPNIRVIIDTEKYRVRREESLIRMARKVAAQVKKSQGSQLLDPMNPFERRLIHTALSADEHINTVSEGEGVYKQIRVFYHE